MGFGGTGSYILTAIKQISVIKHGEKPGGLQFIEFDTLSSGSSDEEGDIFNPGKYLEGDEENNENFLIDKYSEYFHLSDSEPDLNSHIETHVFPPVDNGYEHFENWLHAKWMSKYLPQKQRNIETGAGQHRQVGRYAMFRNALEIRNRVKDKLKEVSKGHGVVPVWLVGSAAGGTGAGTMIDAAFITRSAAKSADIKIDLAGVVVLPSVYKDVMGIDEARVHSFFRELERFQTATDDKFKHNEEQTASFVRYRNFRSNVSTQLFDNLIYVGEPCTNDADRRKFFTSVGNAIEPYLDGEAGADLLEATANDTRAFSSFGATRLYVPRETYADLFTQEQMQVYFDAVVPRAAGEDGLEAGTVGQRRSAAEARAEAILNFEKHLDRKEWSEQRFERFVDNLSPTEIVTEWYQFNNIASGEDRRSALNAYANPLYSLTEPDPERVDEAEINLKTYNEYRNNSGSETQEVSRERFYKKLQSIKDSYTNEEGGPKTFEKGRNRIHEVVTAYLISQIDSDMIGALTGPVTDTGAPGTSLTRLFEEVKHLCAKDGPLVTVKNVLGEMVKVAKKGEERAEEVYNAERELLNRENPSGLFGSWRTWVEAPQQDARDAATDYFDWYQKRRLLQVQRDVVQEVQGRYEAWHAQIKEVTDVLVLGDSTIWGDTEDKITKLEGRLDRMSQQGTAMISLAEEDTTMQGYQDVLRRIAVTSKDGVDLSEDALDNSKWEASVGKDGPGLSLTVGENIAVDSRDAPLSFSKDLRRALNERFRTTIDTRLKKKDVFDYLNYVIENNLFDASDIAERLEKTSAPLLSAGGLVEYFFVHYQLGDSKKARLAEDIRDQLNEEAKRLAHSDEDAITLIKAKKPKAEDVTPELDDYKKSYTKLINTGGREGKEEDFKKVQVNHPFRPELEAWFIERYFQEQNPIGSENYYLPPRIVRLLEYPQRMQAFVYCLASGAIEKTTNNRGEDFWIWHNTERDRECKLTDHEVEDHDLIQAATTFVLKKKPFIYTFDIELDEAHESARKKAEYSKENVQKLDHQGSSLEEKVEEFTEEESLGKFITEHATSASDDEKKGLERVFQFYGRWGAGHGLHNRIL